MDALLQAPKNTTVLGKTVIETRGITPDFNWSFSRTDDAWFGDVVDEVRRSHPHIKNLYMPIPSTMTGRIATHEEFELTYKDGPFRLWGGVPADGTTLDRRGDAFAMVSADCPIGVFSTSSNTVVGHMGLRCLMETKIVAGVTVWDTGKSVLGNMRRAIVAHKKDIRVHLVCGIRTGYVFSPSHKQFGETNRALAKFLQANYPLAFNAQTHEVDMIELVRQQLIHRGIPKANITDDGIDTFADLSYASNVREKGPRNLVFVGRT